MSFDLMKNFWISWYSDIPLDQFEMHRPWWISGYDADDRPIVCAAVPAPDEQAARLFVRRSYDNPPDDLDWRFVEERPDDWSPFNSRFEEAKWMIWEPTRRATIGGDRG